MAKKKRRVKKKKDMSLIKKGLIVLTLGIGIGLGGSYYLAKAVQSFGEIIIQLTQGV